MKKIVALLTAMMLLLACVPALAEGYTVGICQFAPHVALDAATQGFKDALNELLPGQVTILDQNALGEFSNVNSIIDTFVGSNVDLIMANATPAVQAAASATNTIPVLGTAVTHYGTALEIEDWTGVVGTNVSGTSDLAPLDQQAAMIKEWFPEVKVVGLLYCSAEANSVFQVETIAEYLKDMGIECKDFSFTDASDITAAAEAACAACDVLYVPTDNTAANNTEAIANAVIPLGKPVIAGEEGICSGCGVATLSISYYELGYITGQMAVKVLTGEANIAEMAIEYAPNVTSKYNADMCAALNITPVEGYVAIGE